MFSLLLESRESREQLDERLASRMVLQNIMLNLASADDYAAGLTQQSPNLLDYIHGGTPSGAGGPRQGGVAVVVKGQFASLGMTPTQDNIQALVEWLNSCVPKSNGVFSTDRLGELWLPATGFTNEASGILVILVSNEPSDFIIWFRPELVGTTNWAGEPKKTVESNAGGDTLSPRNSFEVWKEIVRGRCFAWSPADLDAAFDLRVSLLHVVLRRINAAAQERKLATERDRLLMAELDHRVKNTIANIQALVMQTSRSADSLTGFVEGLDGRIQAMAKAHSLLSNSRWEGVSIEALLHEELIPYASEYKSVTIQGTYVMLTPKSVLSLSLAVHELATNAAKYGALTTPGGSVDVQWQTSGDDSITLTWTETGEPLVQPPKRRGFGSTLIERALGMETGGHAIMHYPPTGVVCDIFLPSTSILQPDKLLQSNKTKKIVSDSTEKPLPLGPSEAFRILVVEDSFLLFTTLQTMLDDLGWILVGPATRRAEAFAMAEKDTFDVALLDVNLDGEMSWSVARLLKTRGIPFLFVTAYDVSLALLDDLAESTIMAKPYRLSDVEQQVREVIATKRRSL